MRKPFILLVVVTVIILCAVPVVHSFKAMRHKNEIAALQTRLEEVSHQVEQYSLLLFQWFQ